MADNELDKAIEEILERFMYSFTHLDDPMDLRLTTTALKTLLTSEKNKAVLEARQEAVDYFSWRIDCSTLISELEGWRGCVEMAKDQTERHFALKSTNKNKE